MEIWLKCEHDHCFTDIAELNFNLLDHIMQPFYNFVRWQTRCCCFVIVLHLNNAGTMNNSTFKLCVLGIIIIFHKKPFLATSLKRDALYLLCILYYLIGYFWDLDETIPILEVNGHTYDKGSFAPFSPIFISTTMALSSLAIHRIPSNLTFSESEKSLALLALLLSYIYQKAFLCYLVVIFGDHLLATSPIFCYSPAAFICSP